METRTYYNLLYREDERELIPICRQMNVSLMPYSPLAAGHLTRPEWNSEIPKSYKKESRVIKRCVHVTSEKIYKMRDIESGAGEK